MYKRSSSSLLVFSGLTAGLCYMVNSNLTDLINHSFFNQRTFKGLLAKIPFTKRYHKILLFK